MKNIKHTKEYAEKLAKEIVGGNDLSAIDIRIGFTFGYMKALEETAAPDLLEACRELLLIDNLDELNKHKTQMKAIKAINKSTK